MRRALTLVVLALALPVFAEEGTAAKMSAEPAAKAVVSADAPVVPPRLDAPLVAQTVSPEIAAALRTYTNKRIGGGLFVLSGTALLVTGAATLITALVVAPTKYTPAGPTPDTNPAVLWISGGGAAVGLVGLIIGLDWLSAADAALDAITFPRPEPKPIKAGSH